MSRRFDHPRDPDEPAAKRPRREHDDYSFRAPDSRSFSGAGYDGGRGRGGFDRGPGRGGFDGGRGRGGFGGGRGRGGRGGGRPIWTPPPGLFPDLNLTYGQGFVGRQNPLKGIRQLSTNAKLKKLTVKQWINLQPDEITLDQVVKNYTEYSKKYECTALRNFFRAYNDMPWFRITYDPSQEQKEKRQAMIQRRLDLFKKLKTDGTLGTLRLDNDHAEAVKDIFHKINSELDSDPGEPKRPTSYDPAKPPKELVALHLRVFRSPGFDKAAEDNREVEDMGNPDQISTRGSTTLVCTGFPASVSQERLEAALRYVPGFRRVALTTPTEHSHEVLAYATFFPARTMPVRVEMTIGESAVRFCEVDSGDLIKDDNFAISGSDIPLLRRLVQHFDALNGLDFDEGSHPLSPQESVDAHILYLRLVHSYDVGSGREDMTEDGRKDRCTGFTMIMSPSARGRNENRGWVAEAEKVLSPKAVPEDIEAPSFSFDEWLSTQVVPHYFKAGPDDFIEGKAFQTQINPKKFKTARHLGDFITNKLGQDGQAAIRAASEEFNRRWQLFLNSGRRAVFVLPDDAL